MQAPPSELELPAIHKRHHALTRFLLRRLERHLGVHIRLHGADDQFASEGGMVVANQVTHLETFVIPFVLYRELGLTVRILAPPTFFTNKVVGHYLRSIGALPTNDPSQYEMIARDVLHGGWWLMFPEATVLKGRNVVRRRSRQGRTECDTPRWRRYPNVASVAIIALTAQRYKDTLRRALEDGTTPKAMGCPLGIGHGRPSELSTGTETLPPFPLKDSVGELMSGNLKRLAYRPVTIVPLNVTYYPLNPQDGLIESLTTRLAAKLVHPDGWGGILEALTIESSKLLKGVEIDMRLGTPLTVESDVRRPENWRVPWSSSSCRRHIDRLRAWRPARRCIGLLDRWSTLHGRRQRRRAWHLTQSYMRELDGLTTVNTDHLLSGLLRLSQRWYQRRCFSVPELKQRLYLALQMLGDRPAVHLHAILAKRELHIRLLTDQPYPGIDRFAQRAVANNLLSCTDNTWTLLVNRRTHLWSFGMARRRNFMQVCNNEIEPLTDVMQVLHQAVRLDLGRQQGHLVDDLFAYEQHLYEADYATYRPTDATKISPVSPEVGRPVFLRSTAKTGAIGVLLIHGYGASPAELLPLSRYLHAQGLTVYAVRLRGHGTSPYDLQRRSWHEWFDSVLRGYYCLRTVSDIQFVGGMSTGGALALYLAAQQGGLLQGVFAVGTPIKLHNRYLRLVPVAKTIRDFIRSEPENPHTNYTYQPLRAIWQLTQFIEVYQKALSQITQPVLLIQAQGDPTVRPESAQMIYDQLQSQDKRLLWKNVDRHVIIGENYPEVHRDIHTFLQQHSALAVSVKPPEACLDK